MLQDFINAAAVLGLGLGSIVVMFAILCGPARTRKFARWIYWVAHHHCTKAYRRMRRRAHGRAQRDWDSLQLEIPDLPPFDERFTMVTQLYHSLPWTT